MRLKVLSSYYIPYKVRGQKRNARKVLTIDFPFQSNHSLWIFYNISAIWIFPSVPVFVLISIMNHICQISTNIINPNQKQQQRFNKTKPQNRHTVNDVFIFHSPMLMRIFSLQLWGNNHEAYLSSKFLFGLLLVGGETSVRMPGNHLITHYLVFISQKAVVGSTFT